MLIQVLLTGEHCEIHVDRPVKGRVAVGILAHAAHKTRCSAAKARPGTSALLWISVNDLVTPTKDPHTNLSTFDVIDQLIASWN